LILENNISNIDLIFFDIKIFVDVLKKLMFIGGEIDLNNFIDSFDDHKIQYLKHQPTDSIAI